MQSSPTVVVCYQKKKKTKAKTPYTFSLITVKIRVLFNKNFINFHLAFSSCTVLLYKITQLNSFITVKMQFIFFNIVLIRLGSLHYSFGLKHLNLKKKWKNSLWFPHRKQFWGYAITKDHSHANELALSNKMEKG